MRKLSFFDKNFQNSFQDAIYYRMSNLMILTWQPSEYNTKIGKNVLFYLGPKKVFLSEDSFEDLQINSK